MDTTLMNYSLDSRYDRAIPGGTLYFQYLISYMNDSANSEGKIILPYYLAILPKFTCGTENENGAAHFPCPFYL